MGTFEYLLSNEDLGVSVIENLFINHYMPQANGEYVKVYLWGLKYAAAASHAKIDDNTIAQALGLLETDVLKAWEYWQKEGILRLIPGADGTQTIQYLNIQATLLSGKPQNKARTDKERKRVQMFFQIEELYARPLSSEELSIINAWADDYGFSEQVILLLVNDCAKRDIKNFNYLSKVAKSWYDSDVKSYDDALDYLSENNLRWERYFEIFKYLGFHRTPSETEQKLIDGWFDKYGFDMAKIKQACDTTAATDKPSIKYIDTVIKNWNEEKAAPKAKKSTPAKKNSRHRLSDVHDYDFSDLERRWLNKSGGHDEISD